VVRVDAIHASAIALSQPDMSADRLLRLSPRERQVLALLANAASNKEIADRLSLSRAR